MTDQHFVLFYVNSPAQSAEFYAELLRKPAIEASPTFAMFALSPALMLGLWDKQGVKPPAPLHIGGSELAFALPDKSGVDAMYAHCGKHRFPIAQEPIQLDFGYTFVVLDPDGHRLRVFTPSAT